MIVRSAEQGIKDALADTPVVAIQGPRQSGKTTLSRSVAPDLPYVTLDDSLALDAALRSPKSFLAAYPDGVVLDEIQRAPGLFRSIKAEVDKDRRPGRFLLTGSSNILLHPKLSESLAGRMETVTLWPLSEAELAQSPGARLWAFEDGAPPSGPVFDFCRLGVGGFPEPVGRASEARRRAWFESYVKALVERDVRDLADIEGLAAIPRILRLLARQAGETLNMSSLSRESGIPNTTLKRYLALLDAVFLTAPLPAWQSGLTHRVIKASKVIFSDSGVLLNLLGMRAERLDPTDPTVKSLLVNHLAMELRKMALADQCGVTVSHFRSIRSYEIPLILEHPDGRISAFDLAMSTEPEPGQFKALEFLAEVAGDRMHRGTLLHLGDSVQPVSDKLWAGPVSSLWSG